MPRQARTKSESGIYHVMLRGINKQQIFEDEEDCEKYIQVLRECKAISEFELFAYCLMGNHIHLLIKPETRAEMISTFYSKGLSIRQASRLTGISVGIVRKFLNT